MVLIVVFYNDIIFNANECYLNDINIEIKYIQHESTSIYNNFKHQYVLNDNVEQKAHSLQQMVAMSAQMVAK